MRGIGDFRQGGRERGRLAADLAAQIVGGIFARAADRHLHDHGGDRRKDHHRERADHAHAVILAIAATEEHAELREHGNRAGNRRGDGHDQGVEAAL